MINHKETTKKTILTIYPLIVILVMWQLVSILLFKDSILFPSPYKVFISFYKLTIGGILLTNIIHSFFRVIIGFLIGSFLGIILGMLMGNIKQIEIFFNPIVNLLQPIPKIAWIPLAILWFGLNIKATLFIISLATFWSVLFNTWNGVKSVNKIFMKVAKSFGAKKMYIYFNVLLPASLPQIITGMRLGIARAWRALIAAELLIAGTTGIGYMIFKAREFFRTEEIIVGMITIGVVGIFIEKVLFRTIEKKTMERWGTYQNS